MSDKRLYFTALVALQSASLFGYSVGFIGGVLVLPSFLVQFGLADLPGKRVASMQSLIVLLWIVGATCGVALGTPVCAKQGRRRCMALAALLYLIGAALELARIEDQRTGLAVFNVGRLLNGIGTGAGTLATPMYIGEIAPPSHRGMLMSGFQTVYQCSALIGFWSAYFAHKVFSTGSSWQWQFPVALQLVPGLVLLLGTLVIRETPRFSAGKERWEKAGRDLAWLRGCRSAEDEAVQTELDEIKLAVETRKTQLENAHKTSFWKEASRKGVRNRLGLGVGLMVAGNLSGLNMVNYYAPVIFMTAGFTSVSSSLFLSGLFGVMKVLSALLYQFLFVKYRGNRFWLILGSTVCAICMVILAICLSMLPLAADEHSNHSTTLGIISVVAVYIFTISFGVSFGPIAWNVCAEIFPIHIKAQCCAITTGTQWAFNALVSAIGGPLIATIGWKTYVIFAVFCTIALIWIIIFVPETKGVPLGAQMDEVFGLRSAADQEQQTTDKTEHIEMMASKEKPV